MRRILVLGSSGFLGSHMVDHFLKRGFQVAGLDPIHGSSIQPTTFFQTTVHHLPQVCASHSFDLVVNCAGSGNVPLSVSNPALDRSKNFDEPLFVLETLSQLHSPPKLIHLSSAAAYGNSPSPQSEDHAPEPISPYGTHKVLAEQVHREYAQRGLKALSVRIFSAYGVGLRKQLFWDLKRKCDSNPSKVFLYGDGTETRDYIEATEICEAIELLSERAHFVGEVFNLGSGTATSIREAAQTFFEFYSPLTQIEFSGEKLLGAPNRWQANIQKLQALGFESKICLTEGLKKYVQWINSLAKDSAEDTFHASRAPGQPSEPPPNG